jgi:hypothetical protein
MTDEEEEAWFDAAEDNSPEVKRATYMGLREHDFFDTFGSCSPGTGYDLVKAAMERGYDPETSGHFEMWFFSYLGEWLKTAEPIPQL